jgi:hypothetical protein
MGYSSHRKLFVFFCQATFTNLNIFVAFIYIKKQTKEIKAMYTTSNEEGILNNYATEPQLHYAKYPSADEQQRYAFQGAIAALFVTALILVSFAVS